VAIRPCCWEVGGGRDKGKEGRPCQNGSALALNSSRREIRGIEKVRHWIISYQLVISSDYPTQTHLTLLWVCASQGGLPTELGLQRKVLPSTSWVSQRGPTGHTWSTGTAWTPDTHATGSVTLLRAHRRGIEPGRAGRSAAHTWDEANTEAGECSAG